MLIAVDRLPKPWLGIAVIVPAVWVMDYFPLDYNAYGLLLVLIFRYIRSYGLVIAHLALNVIYMFYYGWTVQMLSLLPTLVIAYGPSLWGNCGNGGFRDGSGGLSIRDIWRFLP